MWLLLSAPHSLSPEYSSFPNSVSELPFHSEETITQLLFKIKLPELTDELQISFTLRWKIELRVLVKEFPKPKAEPQVFFEEFRVTIGPLTLGCQIFVSLYTCWEDLAELKNGCKKQDGETQRMISKLLGFNIQRPEKAHTVAVEFLQAILEVFPATLIGLFFKHANRHTKMNLCHSLNPLLEALFLWHSGLHIINKVTQPALAAFFVNGLSSKISGLIKGQKSKMGGHRPGGIHDSALHFERTLEQDWKQKSTQLLAFQLQKLQGQRPKTTPGAPAFHPPQRSVIKMLVPR